MSGSAKAKITDADRAAAEIGAKTWNDFVTMYGPVQDHLLSITNNTAKAHARAVGEASAEATMAVGLTPEAVQAQLATSSKTGSINPLGDVADRASAARRGLGAAYGTIEPAVKERQIRGNLKVAAIDRGVADAATLGMGELGRSATVNELGKVQRATDMRNGLINAAGTAAGSYTAYRMYGNRDRPGGNAPIIDKTTGPG
jgi:hypothetical protein